MKKKRIVYWNLSRLSYLFLLLLVFIIPQLFTGFMLLITIIGGIFCCAYIVLWIIKAKDIEFEDKFDEGRVQNGIGAVLDNEIHLSESKRISSH